MKTKASFTRKAAGILTGLFLAMLLLSDIGTFAQSAGDYRSFATGDWTVLASWQRYDGSTWLTPSSVQGYPGQFTGTGLITIQAGHTMTIGTTGISTQPMGNLIILNGGTLYLNGSNAIVVYELKSSIINVNAGGTIYFNKKSRLTLPLNGVIHVTDTPVLGLSGDCSNNQKIYIGPQNFAACNVAPGVIFTFAELMASGGTLNSVIAQAVPPSPVCEGTSIYVPGTYTGAAGTTTPNGAITGVNYAWTVTGPSYNPTPFTSTDQNITIPTTVLPGTYLIKLTVSTYNETQLYTNTDSNYMAIHPLPTLTGAAQAAEVCHGSAATINMSGLVPNATFTMSYTINSEVQTPIAGLVSTAGGLSNFTTPVLTYAMNGYNLQITGITNTVPATNCAQTFARNVTLAVSPVTVGGTATATASHVCTGTGTTVNLTGHTGTIQWQQSADGSTGWANVTGGSGGTTATYTTPNLTASTWYRAVVTSGACTPANSTTTSVTVVPAAPVANFSASSLLPEVDQTVVFTDLSTGSYVTWAWSFSPGTYEYVNGTSASVPNPQVDFTVNGIYSATLQVTNACGVSTETKTDYFHVGDIGSWTGLTSTDWHTASNWHNYLVPDNLTDVTLTEPAKINYWPDYLADFTLGALCRTLTVEGAAEMTIEGDFTIGTGAELDITGTGIVRIGGDWTNNGTFNCGTGTVEFIGTGQSIIPSGNNETFYNLHVNKENADLTNQANIIVTNDLIIN